MIDQKSQQQLAAWGYGTLVQRELTRDALLAKEPGLTPEQAEQAIPAWLQRQGLKTQAEAQCWIQSYCLAEEDLKALAERQLRWQLPCEKRFRAQASTLFLKRKSQRIYDETTRKPIIENRNQNVQSGPVRRAACVQ